jgi:hypothetical protein
VSTHFRGVLKMHFGELKMRFMPTSPIHILYYIQNFFDSLEFSECVILLKEYLHSCSCYLFQKLSSLKFRSNSSTIVGYIWSFFGDLKGRKYLLENFPVKCVN